MVGKVQVPATPPSKMDFASFRVGFKKSLNSFLALTRFF
jgi:hypothetical protein